MDKKHTPWAIRGFIGMALVLALLSLMNGDMRNACFALGLLMLLIGLYFNQWMLALKFGSPEFHPSRIENPAFFVVGILTMGGALTLL